MSDTPDLARDTAARESGVSRPSESPPTKSPKLKSSLPARIFGATWPLLVLILLTVIDFPVCPSRGMLGVPCPGCGLTRATLALLHGDFAGMLHFHPMAPILAPLFGFTLLRSSAVSAGLIDSGKWDLFAKVPTWIWMVTVFGMLGLFGLRAAGLLGGLPDPIDFNEGLIAKAFAMLSP